MLSNSCLLSYARPFRSCYRFTDCVITTKWVSLVIKFVEGSLGLILWKYLVGCLSDINTLTYIVRYKRAEPDCALIEF